MNRQPSAGEQFRRELLGVLPVEAQSAALGVLKRWGGASVYLPSQSAVERQIRRNVAAVLLKAGNSKAEVTRMIRERFGVSERHARRIVASGQNL